MTAEYNPHKIEKKWQQKWAEDRLYEVTEDPDKKKYYALTDNGYHFIERYQKFREFSDAFGVGEP